MINDLKTAACLMRKSYQFKFSVIASVLFILAGVLLLSAGSVAAAIFIFLGCAMYPIQLLMNLGFSGYVTSSPLIRRLRVGFPVKVYLAGCGVGLLLVSVLTAVFLALPDANRALIWNDFLYYGLGCAIFGIYITLAYTMFILSTVIMLLSIYLPLLWQMEFLMHEITEPFFSEPVTVLITVVLIALSALIQYGLNCLLYRRPMSKFAVNWNLRKQIT